MVAVERRVQELVPEPPTRLLAFDLADWLPLVDLSEYDPEMYRNRRPDGPYGPPSLSREDWARQQARWTFAPGPAARGVAARRRADPERE